MKSKSFVKFLVLAGVLCLVMGMASVAMAAMSITDITAQTGQPLVDVDGNVKMKVVLGGATIGEQVTIKVEDYDAVLANSSDSLKIKYIDQLTVSDAGEVIVPSFKLKDAAAATSKTYKVTVGGTGVSSPRAEAIYKLSTQTAAFTPVKAWIVGPTVVKAGTAYTYEIKAVDAQGRLGSVTGWTVVSPASGATISGNVITANFASQGPGTVNVSKDGVTVTPLPVTVIASDATVVPYISPDSITNATTGVKLGANAVVSKLPSGAFVDKAPIVQGGSAIAIQVPAAPEGATNTVKVGLIGGALSTISDGNFTPNAPGKYRMLIETTANGNTTTKTVFFTVLSSTDYSNVTLRSDITANAIIVNTTADNKIALTFARKTGNTYDYWILPMTGRLMPGETYQNVTADKSFWTKLDVTTNGNVTTFTKPASDKDYRISIYAKHSATVANVDAYRVITIRINADGSVQRLDPNGNGSVNWVSVTALP